MLVLACSDPDPPRARDPEPSPEHALDVLRRFVAARDSFDQHVAGEIMATGVVWQAGDPMDMRPIYGLPAVQEEWKSRAVAKIDNRCTLEIALAADDGAIGLAYCATKVVAKTPPLERTQHLFRIYELGLDHAGMIANFTQWSDLLRAFRQTGVQVDAEPRPDAATGRAIVALAARRDEASNAAAVRDVIAALDRGDIVAVAHAFGADYVHRRLDEAEPRTFASGDAVARFLHAPCTYRAHTTLAAADWVAVRFSRGCPGDRHVASAHLWLVRFEGGKIVEGWEAWSRRYALAQSGMDLSDLRQRLEAAGLR